MLEEVGMLTRHQFPSALPLRLLFILLLGWAAASSSCAQDPVHFANAAPSSVPSAPDLTQGLTAPPLQPQLKSASTTGTGGNFDSLTPEVQGDLLMVHQKYLAAVDAYRRAPQDSAVVWNKLGIAYQHMYALDVAKLQYEKALSLAPNYAEAINNLGTVYYGQKSYRKAEKCYRKAIHTKPGTASFYSNLGTAYFAQRKYKDGLEAYQRAFAIDPEVFTRDSMERIAEMGPAEEQARLNFTLAEIYGQAGNMKVALVYLRAALSEGFADRKKLMGDKDLASLRETAEFQLLMVEEHMN
jgi:tetratricopeptide (TPR) repeat protein